MRRPLLTVGLTLAMLCAFGVSAAATVILARHHHMTGLLPFMLVGVLELLSTGCAWGWVTTTEPRLKAEFAGIMAASSGVSLVAGALAFGWIGVFPALALLAAVHVTSRMWTTPESRRDTAVTDSVTESVTEPVTGAPETPAAETLPGPSPNPPGTLAEPSRPPRETLADDGDRVSELREWARREGKMPGRDRVKAHFGVGSSTANELRAAAERPTIRAVRDA